MRRTTETLRALTRVLSPGPAGITEDYFFPAEAGIIHFLRSGHYELCAEALARPRRARPSAPVLMAAACEGGLPVMRLLNAQWGIPLGRGITYASSRGLVDVLEAIRAAGAPDGVWLDRGALAAADAGRADVIARLAEFGGELDLVCCVGAAARRGNADTVYWCLDRLPGHSGQLQNALDMGLVQACEGGHTDLACAILDRGAAALDAALSAACMTRNPVLVRRLVEAGAAHCICRRSIGSHAAA